ncbi:hypothetical protein [Haloarchaeobius sp. DYHT-AS-18]|uniref:hypothetical protein n=1 Tax=Haloarchaeobius sp. DYHT-AS-18 TaxID=3446117 RepID=UPI003EC0E103
MTVVEAVDRLRVFFLLLLAVVSFGFLLSLIVGDGWLAVPGSIGLSFLAVSLWERRRVSKHPELARSMTAQESLQYVEEAFESGLTLVWLVVLFLGYTVVLMQVTFHGFWVFGGALVLSLGTMYFWLRRKAIRAVTEA